MFVAVANAGRIAKKRDVSEYVAQGWSKGADGYTYDIPQTNLDTFVEYYEVPSNGCVNGGSGTYCCVILFHSLFKLLLNFIFSTDQWCRGP
jgi:hypothetical protein